MNRQIKQHASMTKPRVINTERATWTVRHVPHGVRHTILRPSFWLGLTLGFPLEHLLWEKAPVFSAITRWLGL